MQNTIRYALFLLIVSGSLFAGCNSEVEDADMTLPTNEEVEEQTGIDNIELEEGSDEEGNPSPEVDDANSSSTGSSSTGNTSASEEASAYEDGTYTAGGTYASPAGPESIGVTLTVKDGAVTAVSVKVEATDQASKMYQENFAKGISTKVVGKSLDEIGGYSSVNGSSLTPNGFDAALEAIKDQASS